MPMCDDGKRMAGKLLELADATAGKPPEEQTDEQRRNGAHAAALLEDHGYECTECAPVVATAFLEGLRAAVNSPKED